MATVTTDIVREFKDLDLNFTIHPVKKDINRNLGAMAVINSVKNLVLTNHYEKPFRPEIGSNVRRLLFENLDVVTATTIRNEIQRMIENYEPRVSIINLKVNADFDNNGFKVFMEFYIVNQTSPVTINFFLERIR
jgi:phage baseplate assembly protein W